MPAPGFSHPVPSACFGCFVLFSFLLSPPAPAPCRKHTLAPSVLPEVFLPFEGIRWVGKCLAGMQALSLEAWLLFQLITEQKSLVFRPWSLAATRPPFSLCAVFHGTHVGWEQRQCAWGLCAGRLCRWRDPCRAVSSLFLQALMKGLGKVEVWGAGAGRPCGPGPEPSCPGAPGSRAQLQGLPPALGSRSVNPGCHSDFGIDAKGLDGFSSCRDRVVGLSSKKGHPAPKWGSIESGIQKKQDEGCYY